MKGSKGHVPYLSSQDLGTIGIVFSIVFAVVASIVSAFGLEPVYLFSAIAFCVCLSVFIVYIRNKTCNSIRIAAGKSTIVVEYGDLFEYEGIVVIPVNGSFDTCVNEQIVSEKSLHGQFIKMYFPEDLSDLEEQIGSQLEGYDPKERDERKRCQYPVGTVVSVSHGGRRFLLLALSEFDQDYHAHLDFERYFQAICGLIRYADMNSQGADIIMPVIGGGLSRLSSDIGDLLNLQVSTIKAMGGLGNGGSIKIVIHKKAKGIVCLPHSRG